MNKEQIYLEWTNKDYGIDTNPGHTPEIQNRPRESENSILFLVEYLLGLGMKSQITYKELMWFRTAVKKIESYRLDVDGNEVKIKGLYDRGGKESLWKDKETIRHISHDNMTAIFFFSKFLNTEFHLEIFNYGKKNFWRYDNRSPENPSWKRFLHPRDLISFCVYGGTGAYLLLGRACLPLLSSIQILSCLKKYKVRPSLGECFQRLTKERKWPKRIKHIHTDGKILMAIRCLCTMEKSLWSRVTFKICYLILKWRFQTDRPLEYLAFLYFKHPEHPVKQSWEGIDGVIKTRFSI